AQAGEPRHIVCHAIRDAHPRIRQPVAQARTHTEREAMEPPPVAILRGENAMFGNQYTGAPACRGADGRGDGSERPHCGNEGVRAVCAEIAGKGGRHLSYAAATKIDDFERGASFIEQLPSRMTE